MCVYAAQYTGEHTTTTTPDSITSRKCGGEIPPLQPATTPPPSPPLGGSKEPHTTHTLMKRRQTDGGKLKQKRLVRRTEEEETFLKKGITPKSSLSLPLSSTSSRVFCKGGHQVGDVSSTTVAPSSKQSQCDLDPLGWSDGVLMMMMFACGVPPYLTLSRRFWHSCTAPV